MGEEAREKKKKPVGIEHNFYVCTYGGGGLRRALCV